jgi:hypothetical protein
MHSFKHASDQKGGSFFYEENGKKLAEMIYIMTDAKKMIIEHTEVDDSLTGKGIGKKLLAELVAYVRAKNIKVTPLCPFARATLKKAEEWQDVLL